MAVLIEDDEGPLPTGSVRTDTAKLVTAIDTGYRRVWHVCDGDCWYHLEQRHNEGVLTVWRMTTGPFGYDRAIGGYVRLSGDGEAVARATFHNPGTVERRINQFFANPEAWIARYGWEDGNEGVAI